MGTTRREMLLSTSALAGVSLLQGGETAAQQSSDPLEEEVAAALNVWDFKKIAQQPSLSGQLGFHYRCRWR